MVTASAAARRAFKAASHVADQMAPPRAGVVVLLYHRVGGGSGTEVDLPPRLFKAQMEALAASGRAVTLTDALAVLAGPSLPEPSPVVITFDDGTRDVLDVAAPIMQQLGLSATLYVATRFIEDQIDFPHSGRPASWAGLKDALGSGVLDIGSHTHDHLLLDRLTPPQAERQLDRSIGLIEDRLSVRPRDFAYPKAVRASGSVERSVIDRFRSAAVASSAPNRPGADPHRLTRTPIQVSDGVRWFHRKLDGGLSLEGRVRHAADRLRYAKRAS